MASRGCLHQADSFCYVCRQFIKTRAKKYSVEESRIMCEAYKAYFDMPVGNQDKSWAQHFTCEYCKKTLDGWYIGEKRAMKFAIPRIWRKPTDHSSNCCFCMVNPKNHHTDKNAYSEEQGEHFHQDILDFECHYEGEYNENMMGDYIWGLLRESDSQYNRKSRKSAHF